MQREFIRVGHARKLAHEYIARLLLNEGEHADAFEDEALTTAELAEARAEIQRISVKFISQHNVVL